MEEEASSPEGSELGEDEQVAHARAFAAALKTDKPGKFFCGTTTQSSAIIPSRPVNR